MRCARQGLEVHQAELDFQGGHSQRRGGRLRDPRRPALSHAGRHVFSVQNYPPANPRPYDDTGWTMQYMRNVKVIPVTDKAVLDRRR